MKPFLGDDFLLGNDTAKTLYHRYAAPCPIFDYHCHLPPADIAHNTRFDNIGQLLLAGDHYKWRGMSACGLGNDFIRKGDDKARFMAYAKIMPRLMGNPLYHWTHLELQRVFGIAEPLCEATAQSVWERANALLATEGFRARGLIERFGVRALCTTDDPVDTLEHHACIAADTGFAVRVLPAFRPDGAVKCQSAECAGYLDRLATASGTPIRTVEDVLCALETRVEHFHAHGCRIADHGLDTLPYAEVDPRRAQAALQSALLGHAVDADDAQHYMTAILLGLSESYCRHGWAQQYHISVQRDINTRAHRAYGPNTGYDAISDEPFARKLAMLLNAQEARGTLPRTILYTLNPAANYAVATVAGSFQGDTPGKVQFGTAWWFADQLDGMREQIKALASIGVLSTFVGMLTDSRSFVSYPRHEYFRRLLCDIIGGWVENSEYPEDLDALGSMVQGICFANAKAYFGIDL